MPDLIYQDDDNSKAQTFQKRIRDRELFDSVLCLKNMESDWFKKARHHLSQNELAQALLCVRRAKKNACTTKQLLIRHDVFKALGCYSVAEAILRILRSGAPDLALFMVMHGELARLQKDYARAESWHRQADDIVARDPDGTLPCSMPLILLGSCMIRQGRIRDAIDVYQTAASLPDDGRNDIDEAWENIGYGYRALGELQHALYAFETAFDEGSNCRAQIADIKAAIKIKQTPETMDDVDVSSLLNDAEMAQALVCAEHQLSRNPKSGREIENYARVLIWLRRFEDAERLIPRLDSQKQETGDPKLNSKDCNQFRKLTLMAELEECRGDFDSAIRFYREAILQRPNAVYLWIEMGQCLLLRQNLDEARDAFLTTLKLIDDDCIEIKAHSGLASIYRMTGRFASAAEHFFAAASIEPKNRTYKKAGNDAAAAAKMQSSMKPFTPEEPERG